jgi:hypothetical protein
LYSVYLSAGPYFIYFTCAALNILDLAKDGLTLVNNGAIAEQFVGQNFLYGGPSHIAPSLYYWIPISKKNNNETLSEKRRSFSLRPNTPHFIIGFSQN